MAATIKQTEAIPAAYPATPSGLSAAATALDAAVIWQRIEAYTCMRWTARAVVWTVEGPGEWVAPLAPATISTTEQWTGIAWEAFLPGASPLGGYQLDGEGPYRFAGTVGSGAVPATVSEAFRRLAEYLASTDDAPAGASEFTWNLGGGAMSENFSRAPTWIARAMINSGAADLLRPYRGLA
jgi:hypothetical protein